MKFTNHQLLPSSIFDAISSAPEREKRRGNADISVTQLIDAPRIFQLAERYDDQLVVDVSDRISSLMGSALHELIGSKASGRTHIRLYSQWMGTEKSWIVSGEIDLIDEEDVLWDYKFCKVAALADGIKEEWEAQLNLYNKLCEDNGIYVCEMKIHAIFTDWSPEGIFRQHGYPPHRSMTYIARMWSRDSVDAYIQYRLTQHEQYFPLCTMQERWAEPNTWALMREDRKRAVRVYETEHECRNQLELRRRAMPNVTWYVQERLAMSKRCRFYCPVWEFCDFGQAERGTNAGGPP